MPVASPDVLQASQSGALSLLRAIEARADQFPRCQSSLEPVGMGTERIEEAVRRMFPQARVGRVDGETIRRPADARAFIRLFHAGSSIS